MNRTNYKLRMSKIGFELILKKTKKLETKASVESKGSLKGIFFSLTILTDHFRKVDFFILILISLEKQLNKLCIGHEQQFKKYKSKWNLSFETKNFVWSKLINIEVHSNVLYEPFEFINCWKFWAY